DNAEIVWDAGRAVVSQESDGLRVAAAFEQQEGHLLAFRVEVENDTSDPIDFDPTDVSYVACGHEHNCTPSYPALDPESQLVVLDRAHADEVAAGANQEAIGVALMLIG